MSDSIKQQRQSYQATINRALDKLKTAKEHYDKFERDIDNLKKIIKDTQEKLDKLPPLKFEPNNNGVFFPNINYKDVYAVGVSSSFEVAERMAVRGLRCNTEKDARRLSKYLVVIGKIANYAQQANNAFSFNHQGENKSSYIIGAAIQSDGIPKLAVQFVSKSVLPIFYSEADARVVLDLLTDTEKDILLTKGAT